MAMQRQTLASAFNVAIDLRQQKKQSQAPKGNEKSGSLVAALEQSTTRMDQIVQRRIGLTQESENI